MFRVRRLHVRVTRPPIFAWTTHPTSLELDLRPAGTDAIVSKAPSLRRVARYAPPTHAVHDADTLLPIASWRQHLSDGGRWYHWHRRLCQLGLGRQLVDIRDNRADKYLIRQLRDDELQRCAYVHSNHLPMVESQLHPAHRYQRQLHDIDLQLECRCTMLGPVEPLLVCQLRQCKSRPRDRGTNHDDRDILQQFCCSSNLHYHDQ